jgi:hypothetical protein
MARVRYLEGRDAGLVARIVQRILKSATGQSINPPKAQAHSTRAMLSSFFANAIMGQGRWEVGKDMVELVKIRAAALNGCPF